MSISDFIFLLLGICIVSNTFWHEVLRLLLVLANMNIAVMNLLIQVYVWIYVFISLG